MDEYYDDPRYSSSQGRLVTYDADAGAVWEPLSVAAPLGQYVGTGDSGGQYVEYSAQERADVAAQQEADRQAKLQKAAAYVAANPLAISGNQIDTRYGQMDTSYFNPIVDQGQSVTGSTLTQLIDPATNAPVYLSNPSDPFSYTYEDTGTPAIGGTLEQQAAMYRPMQQKGAFGTIGGDLLSAAKDPYFHKFLAAAAAMAGGAALGAQGAGAGVGSTGATAYPVALGDTITVGGFGSGAGATGGAGFGSTAGGFLGGSGDILAGAAGSGGGSLGGSTLGGMIAKGGELLSGPYGSLIKGGLSLGGTAAANALKPQTNTSTGTSSLTSDQLQAIVAGMPSMIEQYTSQAQNGMGQNYNGYNAPSSIANLFPSYSLTSAQMPTVGSTNAPVYGAGRFAPLI